MAKPKKEMKQQIKLQIQAGKANPSPPVGPALGQAGVNIMEFCNAFNDKTKQLQGPIPVIISVYKDRSFTFETKLSPVSYMIKEQLKLKKGSTAPGQQIVGKITKQDIEKVAERKMADLNANDLKAACRMVAGTAISMGLDVAE